MTASRKSRFAYRRRDEVEEIIDRYVWHPSERRRVVERRLRDTANDLLKLAETSGDIELAHQAHACNSAAAVLAVLEGW